MKKIVAMLMLVGLISVMAACGSSEPCNSCGETPTKAYENTVSGEKEYYCEACSSDCAFCSGEATKHYTSAAGLIIFACSDCYEEIQELSEN